MAPFHGKLLLLVKKDAYPPLTVPILSGHLCCISVYTGSLHGMALIIACKCLSVRLTNQIWLSQKCDS